MNTLVASTLDILVTPELQRLLSEEMELTGHPPAEVVSEAILSWLHSRSRRRQIDAEVTAYAVAHAGTESDLDLGLEAAGIECLLHDDVKEAP